jgi:hypothetical protein
LHYVHFALSHSYFLNEYDAKRRATVRESQARRRKNLTPAKRDEEKRQDKERKQKAQENKQKIKINMTEEERNEYDAKRQAKDRENLN